MFHSIQSKKNARVVHYDSTFESVLSQYDIPLPPRAVPSSHVLRWGRKSDGGQPCFAVKFEVGDGYCFGDWSRDLEFLAYPNKEYTQAELRQIKTEMKKASEKADKERKDKLLFSTQLANQIWDTSTPVVSKGHAYLTLKKIQSFGLRMADINQLADKIGLDIRKAYGKDLWEGEDSLLVVPLKDIDGTVQSLQFINSKGIKRFLKDGVGSGCFPIGEPPETDGYILLCEGYATGASLHETTWHYTICCMGTSGLKSVAKAVRTKYPEAKMIMCADDDGHKDDPSKINVGLEKAKEAGNAVGAYVFHPVFSDTSENPSDFNDLYCREGIDAVKKQVNECLQVIAEGGNRANVFQPAVAKQSKIAPPQDFSEGNIIEIIAYVFDMQSGNYSLRVKFLDYRGRLRELDLAANEVQESRLLQAKLRSKGFDFSLVYDFKALHEYLKTAKPPKEIKRTNQTGWIKKNVYVSQCFIVSRDECEYEFAGGAYHGYGIRGTLEEWKTEVAKYAVGNHSLTDGLCAGLSGMLMQYFEDVISSTVLHFYGKSRKGKTTMLNMVASLHGYPKYFKKSWGTTKNGIECLLSTHNDACLVLDEFGKIEAKAFERMSYLIEGGEGKARMSGDASLRETSHWRTIVVSTGEITMADKIRENSDRPVMAGESMRFLGIPSESKHGIFDTLHGFKSGKELSKHLRGVTAKYYGTASQVFVEYAIGLEEDNIRKLYDDALQALNEKFGLHKADGQVTSVADVFALKQTAGELAAEAGILPHTKEQIQESIHVSFKKWLDERGDLNSYEERQVLTHVTGFLFRNDRKFIEKYTYKSDGKIYENVKHDPRTEVWGYVQKFEDSEKRLDRSVYYIEPSVFKEIVLKGFPYKTSCDALKELGMLKIDAEGRHPKSPFDNRKRFVTIEI